MFGRTLTHGSVRAAGTAGALSTSLVLGQISYAVRILDFAQVT